MIRDTDILKLIHGELNSDDAARVRQDIAASPAVQGLHKQYSYIYDNREGINGIRDIDTKMDWEKLKSKLDIKHRKRDNVKWIYLAMGLVVLSAIAVGMYYYLKPAPYIIEHTDIAAMTITLPDGSVTLLKPHSELTYHRYMMTDSIRFVKLVGDAQFDVTSNPDKPFIVESDGIAIEVLGTVFTIDQQNTNSIIENKEGLIKCFDPENPSSTVTLKEGDKAVWDGAKFEYVPVYDTPPTKGELIRIDDFIDEITTRYPTDVEFSPYMLYDDRNIFVKMDQNLEGIMSQLDSSSAIQYIKQGSRYKIDSIAPN